MRHFRQFLAALLFSVLSVHPAIADYIYTFTTTNNAPFVGPLIGYFVVSDSAIVDGFIRVSEIKAFYFVLPYATTPFVHGIFALPDNITIFSPISGSILVDPVSGRFLQDSAIVIVDNATGQILGVTTYPGVTPPLVPQYSLETGSGPFAQSQGQGSWVVQKIGTEVTVPVLGPSSLVVLALALVAVALSSHAGFRSTNS